MLMMRRKRKSNRIVAARNVFSLLELKRKKLRMNSNSLKIARKNTMKRRKLTKKRKSLKVKITKPQISSR